MTPMARYEDPPPAATAAILTTTATPELSENSRTRTGPTGSVTLRALSLLDGFLPGNAALTLTEMAKRAKLPLSTAHRLAADLTAWGALEKLGDGHFQIGARLRQIAANAPRGTLLRERCLPHLEWLAQHTGGSAMLAILEGTNLVYLEHAHGIGARFKPSVQQPPVLSTAAGRVLTAFAPRVIQEALLQQSVTAITPYTVTTTSDLRAELQRVHGQHFAVAERQVERMHTVLAAPVLDAQGSVLAALSLTVPYNSAITDTTAALREAAKRASQHTLHPTTLPNV